MGKGEGMRRAAGTGGDRSLSSGKSTNAAVVRACRFCEIINDKESAHILFSDDVSVAFLDHRPLFPGHILLVPRIHIETLTDLPDELTAPFFSCARILARAVEEVMEAEGSFVAMNNRVSQSVPHLHVHIVPRRRHDGLKGFFWPRHRYESEAEMVQVSDLLRSTIERLKRG